MKYIACLMLIAVLASCGFGGVAVPSQNPGKARGASDKGQFSLSNDVMEMSWTAAGGKLAPLSIVDHLHGKTWRQIGCDLFHLSRGVAPIDVRYDDIYIGLRIRNRRIDVMVSRDGKSWRNVHQYELSDRRGMSAAVRVGKMDMQGGPKDYPGRGAEGVCSFQDFRIYGAQGAVLTSEDFKTKLDAKVWSRHLSAKKGTSVLCGGGKMRITTGANCATFVQRALPDKTQFVSCRVAKGSDTGMSWGPGLTLVWSDGEFVVCGIRDAQQVNVHTKSGERFIGLKRHNPPQLDLSGSEFRVTDKPRIVDVSEKHAGVMRTGKAIVASLKDTKSGVSVSWRGVRQDGSHYIRQEFSFTATTDTPISGLELLHARIGDAAQIGSVIGSPVATDEMFAGVELPVAGNSLGGLGDLRSGFACKLKLGARHPQAFSTVIGVYAGGQLRRSFLSYIEAERARRSVQFMHYNSWYDLGYNLNAAGIIDAAKQFRKHLVKPFGVKMSSYVLDDSWDDFHRGLWSTNLKRFPGGFKSLRQELAKHDAVMGIWISPMGGYGGDKQRTAWAKKMGLISGARLDLAEDAYYRWYRDKCLSLMKDNGVNYFKWDRAGSGASPHFMALLNIARELRKVNPEVFINVTAGTWPSPFWLNHIDCTWRGEGGDVGWIGKGDDREMWLTFRDQFCYSGVVSKAPIYPLNSLMHHGLVHGRAFQGHRVSKAGSDLKNEARSYFGAGPTMQELYITPSMMTQASWRQVGQAAKWARDNADVLLDTHWVGGVPKKLQVYGYASWSPRKGVLTLRNPDDKPQTFDLDIQKVFELPAEAPRKYKLQNAYADQKTPEAVLTAGKPHTLKLKPFEVLVFDVMPAGR